MKGFVECAFRKRLLSLVKKSGDSGVRLLFIGNLLFNPGLIDKFIIEIIICDFDEEKEYDNKD